MWTITGLTYVHSDDYDTAHIRIDASCRLNMQ